MILTKYPRTFHLPWSPGATNDDKVMDDVSSLLNKTLVITTKMDGSNVCLERSACFARSHSGSPTHPSFDQFKALHASIAHQIPEDTKIFAEWLFARHTIHYTRLPAYLLVFGVRYEDSTFEYDGDLDGWWSWNETEALAKRLGLHTVPVLEYRMFKKLDELKATTLRLAGESDGDEREGVVVRLADGFPNNHFSSAVAKWVRAGHVGSNDEHWSHKAIVKNGLVEAPS